MKPATPRIIVCIYDQPGYPPYPDAKKRRRVTDKVLDR